jgi:hypothetical protein
MTGFRHVFRNVPTPPISLSHYLIGLYEFVIIRPLPKSWRFRGIQRSPLTPDSAWPHAALPPLTRSTLLFA